MKASTIKITIKDNNIMSKFKKLSDYLISINWDQPKIFSYCFDCDSYLQILDSNIMSLLDDNYSSLSSYILNTSFVTIRSKLEGKDIISIRQDRNVEFMQPKYIVLVTDYGETCDGHPRQLGNHRFFMKEDAINEVIKDMNEVSRSQSYKYINKDKLEIWSDKDSVGICGCAYTISEISC